MSPILYISCYTYYDTNSNLSHHAFKRKKPEKTFRCQIAELIMVLEHYIKMDCFPPTSSSQSANQWECRGKLMSYCDLSHLHRFGRLQTQKSPAHICTGRNHLCLDTLHEVNRGQISHIHWYLKAERLTALQAAIIPITPILSLIILKKQLSFLPAMRIMFIFRSKQILWDHF